MGSRRWAPTRRCIQRHGHSLVCCHLIIEEFLRGSIALLTQGLSSLHIDGKPCDWSEFAAITGSEGREESRPWMLWTVMRTLTSVRAELSTLLSVVHFKTTFSKANIVCRSDNPYGGFPDVWVLILILPITAKVERQKAKARSTILRGRTISTVDGNFREDQTKFADTYWRSGLLPPYEQWRFSSNWNSLFPLHRLWTLLGHLHGTYGAEYVDYVQALTRLIWWREPIGKPSSIQIVPVVHKTCPWWAASSALQTTD